MIPVRRVGKISSSGGQIATALLQMERLADALAEGEFADMGLDEAAGSAALAAIIHDLRG